MKLLIVRPGVSWTEDEIPKLKKKLKKKLPNFIILILQGENENIETTFEIINLD